MARKKYGQVSLRFALDNPTERRLFKVVDDLDLSIHKSKNRFIMKALENYVDGYGAENLTETSKREHYITREEHEAAIECIKNEVRTELYQEVVLFLAKATVANAVTNSQVPVQVQEVDKCESVEEYSTVENAPTDEMMENIMKWS